MSQKTLKVLSTNVTAVDIVDFIFSEEYLKKDIASIIKWSNDAYLRDEDYSANETLLIFSGALNNDTLSAKSTINFLTLIKTVLHKVSIRLLTKSKKLNTNSSNIINIKSYIFKDSLFNELKLTEKVTCKKI